GPLWFELSPPLFTPARTRSADPLWFDQEPPWTPVRTRIALLFWDTCPAFETVVFIVIPLVCFFRPAVDLPPTSYSTSGDRSEIPSGEEKNGSSEEIVGRFRLG